MNKHLIWALSLLLIVAMICGTLIYLNSQAWTMRLEMDNNTKEAIESIDYPIVEARLADFTCFKDGAYYHKSECQE